jgi:S1-C subfamily serine protease
MKIGLKHFYALLPIMLSAILGAGSAKAFEQPQSEPAPNESTGKKLIVPLDEGSIQRPVGPYSSFAPIIKNVAPAVVKVVTTQKAANLPDQEILAIHFAFSACHCCPMARFAF